MIRAIVRSLDATHRTATGNGQRGATGSADDHVAEDRIAFFDPDGNAYPDTEISARRWHRAGRLAPTGSFLPFAIRSRKSHVDAGSAAGRVPTRLIRSRLGLRAKGRPSPFAGPRVRGRKARRSDASRAVIEPGKLAFAGIGGRGSSRLASLLQAGGSGMRHWTGIARKAERDPPILRSHATLCRQLDASFRGSGETQKNDQ